MPQQMVKALQSGTAPGGVAIAEADASVQVATSGASGYGVFGYRVFR